ncbi:MAG: multicopper oxidase domain-containing protein [Gammaproteobacteria bacterium]|nr:multicopper oxidase domain-containing protein [Gammaproteobacteria bacterium]
MMNKKIKKTGGLVVAIVALLLFSVSTITQASTPLPFGLGQITGITGPAFSLTAKEDIITIPDGGVVPMWGYSINGGRMQYPGPTLIVNEGDDVIITFTNELPVPTSIVFPGHIVETTGGTHGVLTAEAAIGGADTVTYTFNATTPGTYTYYSGTNMDLQVEMGLVGVIIVRPTDYLITQTAYGTPESAYDVEYLEIFDDIDPDIHVQAAATDWTLPGANVDTSSNTPRYWFINGRAFPDTLDYNLGGASEAVPWLPTQPYSSLTVTGVGLKVLVRVLAAGNDQTPQHYHSNNGKVIARDGRYLETPDGSDQLFEDINTLVAVPGQTSDMIWTWTGQDMDWDFYGHGLADTMKVHEILASTTLAAGILAADASLTIAAWGNAPGEVVILADDKEVPKTHKINAIIYDDGDAMGYPNYTYPNQDTTAEMVTLKFNITSGAWDVDRGMEGTVAKDWGFGSKIAYTEHGRPFPVILPELQDLSFGGVYSGSPFLGDAGTLPPGQGGLNPFNAFAHPWHVHHEKNLLNDDIFVGGQLTILMILELGDVSP